MFVHGILREAPENGSYVPENSSKIKSESQRRCENERCKADISHLHGNAKHCDNTCWMIHQALDIDSKFVTNKEWVENRAKEFLEINKSFLRTIKTTTEYFIDLSEQYEPKFSFRFLLDWMRYISDYHFPNPCQRYFREAFEKEYPEMRKYLK